MRSMADFRNEIAEYVVRSRATGQKYCPVCDQGTLIRAVIDATGEQVNFCKSATASGRMARRSMRLMRVRSKRLCLPTKTGDWIGQSLRSPDCSRHLPPTLLPLLA